MPAEILDGKATADAIREKLKARADALRAQGRPAGLAAVLVGDDPASHTYVRMKGKQSEKTGITSFTHILPADTPQADVEALVDQLNADPAVSGILIQHPLPKGMDELAVLMKVDPRKDVDGISTYSLGALMSEIPAFGAATPLGIITLLEHYQIPLVGKRAVVIGRSVILGKPMALMLLNRHATVTICHSRTQNLADICREADVLVAAVGRAEMVKGDWIKPGAVVVDAGYNRVEGRQGDVGDVAFEEAREVASWITPVPGGVGPMTIATLLSNTIEAAEAAAR